MNNSEVFKSSELNQENLDKTLTIRTTEIDRASSRLQRGISVEKIKNLKQNNTMNNSEVLNEIKRNSKKLGPQVKKTLEAR